MGAQEELQERKEEEEQNRTTELVHISAKVGGSNRETRTCQARANGGHAVKEDA